VIGNIGIDRPLVSGRIDDASRICKVLSSAILRTRAEIIAGELEVGSFDRPLPLDTV